MLNIANGSKIEQSTLKDELPEPRGSLANDIFSRAIERANQEVRKDD